MNSALKLTQLHRVLFNLFIGFNKKQYRFKEKLLSQYSVEWKRRKERWKKEIFERERFWGYLAGNEYAEGFHVGKLVDFYAE